MKMGIRKDAKAKGLKRYFTGKPCKNGHVDWRYTANAHCVSCAKMWLLKWREANPQKVNQYSNNWQKRNRPHMNRYYAEWLKKKKQINSEVTGGADE